MAYEAGAEALAEELRTSLKLAFDPAIFAGQALLPPPDEGHVAV